MKNGDISNDYVESDATEKNRTRRPILGKNRTFQIGRFGQRLEEAIGDESVRSFARRAKLAEGTLRQYISGNRYPDLDFLASSRIQPTSTCSGWRRERVQNKESQRLAR